MTRFLAALMVSVLLASPAALAADDNKDERAAAAGNSAFACDLYSQLKVKDGNLFFSPFSISIALCMTYAGARGETEKQMAQVLHFELPQEKMHSAMGSLISSQSGRMLPAKEGEKGPGKPAYELVMANSIWLAKERKLVPSFESTTAGKYVSPAYPADFRGNPEASRKRINDWVSEKTMSRIPDLLDKSTIRADTPLVLVNAIYFKSQWLSAFNKRLTRPAPFTLVTGKKTDVQMMTRSAEYGFLDGGGFYCVSMPYAGRELSMLVLVPKTAQGLADVEDRLTPKNIDSWISSMKEERLELWLPKFGIESGFELSAVLKKMGMPGAFSDAADFGGMVADQPVKIDIVVHRAFVKVDENGTEAAAATAVLMAPTGMPAPGREFRVDRPFVFLILDNRTSSILFLGRVIDPS